MLVELLILDVDAMVQHPCYVIAELIFVSLTPQRQLIFVTFNT